MATEVKKPQFKPFDVEPVTTVSKSYPRTNINLDETMAFDQKGKDPVVLAGKEVTVFVRIGDRDVPVFKTKIPVAHPGNCWRIKFGGIRPVQIPIPPPPPKPAEEEKEGGSGTAGGKKG